MGTEVLERRFATIGGRLNVVGRPVGSPRIDVARDTRGEFFDVRFPGTGRLVELEDTTPERGDRGSTPCPGFTGRIAESSAKQPRRSGRCGE